MRVGYTAQVGVVEAPDEDEDGIRPGMATYALVTEVTPASVFDDVSEAAMYGSMLQDRNQRSVRAGRNRVSERPPLMIPGDLRAALRSAPDGYRFILVHSVFSTRWTPTRWFSWEELKAAYVVQAYRAVVRNGETVMLDTIPAAREEDLSTAFTELAATVSPFAEARIIVSARRRFGADDPDVLVLRSGPGVSVELSHEAQVARSARDPDPLPEEPDDEPELPRKPKALKRSKSGRRIRLGGRQVRAV